MLLYRKRVKSTYKTVKVRADSMKNQVYTDLIKVGEGEMYRKEGYNFFSIKVMLRQHTADEKML